MATSDRELDPELAAVEYVLRDLVAKGFVEEVGQDNQGATLYSVTAKGQNFLDEMNYGKTKKTEQP